MLSPKIVIQSDADFTPPGKRTARVVTLNSPAGEVRRIRWYVSGRIYDTRPIEDDSITREWIAAGPPPASRLSDRLAKAWLGEIEPEFSDLRDWVDQCTGGRLNSTALDRTTDAVRARIRRNAIA